MVLNLSAQSHRFETYIFETPSTFNSKAASKKGPDHPAVLQDMESEKLRSNLWSAETLSRGMRSVGGQPSTLLDVEAWDDAALFAELQD